MFTFSRKPIIKLFVIFFAMAVFSSSYNEARAATKTLYFRSTASTVVSGNTSVNQLLETAGGADNTGTTVKHAKNVNTWQFIPDTSANTTPYTIPSTPNSKGWIWDGSAPGSFAGAVWTINVDVVDSSATGTGVIKAQVWKVTANSTTVTQVTNLSGVLSSASFTPSTTPSRKTLTFTPSAFSLASGEYIYVETYLQMTVAGSSSGGAMTDVMDSASGTLQGSVVTSDFTPLTTTLGTDTDPGAGIIIAPGAVAQDVDKFTLQTNTGTETINSITVNLSDSTGVGRLAITTDTPAELGFTTTPVTGSNTINVSGMSAGTSIATFRVRITPRSHTDAVMPAPPGGTYSITAPVTGWVGTGGYAHTAGDTNPNALTIDNLSPSATTGASANPGNAQATVSWTNPTGDFSNIVVLRDTADIGTGSTPVEGSSPTVGSSCGGTACQVRYISTGTSFIDTGLSNGTTYYYRLFPKDMRGNYTAYVSTQQVSASPIAPDTASPTPNPMTFASAPANDLTAQISMTSTTGSDSTPPVNYLFTYSTCGANNGTGGTSSSWQSSASYSDTGLQANKCYGYTVTARDSVTPTPNTGAASSVFSTYTSSNTPGAPTLGSPTTSTLNLTNAENGNPASNPTTNFAVQIVTTSDATWLNKWVNASGNPSGTAVWMTDATLDTLTLQGLQASTLYGAKAKARNQDGDETNLGAEGQGTTSAPVATTAISNFVTTEPSDSTIAPGASVLADSFGLQTSAGGDTVTGAIVTLASGTGARVATVAIIDNGDTTTYCSATPSGDTATLTGCGITVNTTNTQFKIKITADSHGAMPAPPGALYAVTAKINSFTSTNTQSGSDSGSATVTIDNASLSATTGASATGGDTQATVSWANPTGDFSNIIVLRDTATIGSGSTPTEGTSPTVGSSCGGTACQVRYISTGTSFIDTGLTNNTTYHYRFFPKDTSGNYTAYDSTQEVSATPSATTFTITATAGINGSIVPSGAIPVAQGSNQTFIITPDTGYNINTLLIDGGSVATTTPYTFTNVQKNYTIEATFIAIPIPPGNFSIAATAGAGGSISPSGLVTVTQGNSQMFTITPDTGYNIASILIDGAPLAATSTTYTFTNVQKNYTIEATFTAPETPAVPARRAPRPITVTFSGKALPFGKISIVDRALASGRETARDLITDITGSFLISFVDIIQGVHTFGILAKDKEGRSTQSKFYTLEVMAHELVEKDILLPPTIDLVRGQVSRGKNVTIIGFATPQSTVRIEIDGILIKEITPERDGSYRADIPTGVLEFGTHKVRAQQYDRATTKTSEYSPLRPLIVSRLVTVEADFSGDGKIDIQDWSIFLARFRSKDVVVRNSIDLNNDGKVTLSDFSIFIRAVRR